MGKPICNYALAPTFAGQPLALKRVSHSQKQTYHHKRHYCCMDFFAITPSAVFPRLFGLTRLQKRETNCQLCFSRTTRDRTYPDADARRMRPGILSQDSISPQDDELLNRFNFFSSFSDWES
ncbi:hypothetical protein AVEN_36975-1 [Araneus ventricosus]|uniref:Uncharacterized protein n=1 Tax=Araneus ventricosus TaxID=182803 RepID=A0A4Y2IGG6_ARAVE|nr:hypothetical protein AVEN_36975-1 [Araneus ventricosus]